MSSPLIVYKTNDPTVIENGGTATINVALIVLTIRIKIYKKLKEFIIMTQNIATWKQTCDVEFRGLQIEANYISEEAMMKNVKLNNETDILFISTNDGMTPTAFQGYNLEETIKIRDYLNNLINLSLKALMQ